MAANPGVFGRAGMRQVNEQGLVCMPQPHTDRCSNVNYSCATQVPALLNPRMEIAPEVNALQRMYWEMFPISNK